MMLADALRWIVFVLSCFSLMTLLVFYQHVGRFILPQSAVRLLLMSSAALTIIPAVEALARLGEPLYWRTPLSLIALVLYLISLIRIEVWFRRPEGRKRRHALIADFLAGQLLKDPNGYAGIAKALAEDPAHAGRIIPPPWPKRLWAWMRAQMRV